MQRSRGSPSSRGGRGRPERRRHRPARRRLAQASAAGSGARRWRATRTRHALRRCTRAQRGAGRTRLAILVPRRGPAAGRARAPNPRRAQRGSRSRAAAQRQREPGGEASRGRRGRRGAPGSGRGAAGADSRRAPSRCPRAARGSDHYAPAAGSPGRGARHGRRRRAHGTAREPDAGVLEGLDRLRGGRDERRRAGRVAGAGVAPGR